jgi:hypothetical protein
MIVLPISVAHMATDLLLEELQPLVCNPFLLLPAVNPAPIS